MTKISPRFSIIIPTYNSESVIKACLSSIYSQKYKSFEIIICDGNSTDKTLAIIKNSKAENRIHIDSRRDNGIYDAMNRGIDLSSGEYLIFLGSDDRFIDERVLLDVDTSLNSTIDVLYGDVQMDDRRYDGEFSLYKLMKTNICHQAMFFKRSLFSTYGKFNTKYQILADYHLNIKLFSDKNLTIKHTPRLISEYGTSGLSSHTQDENFHKDRNQIVRDYFPSEYYEIYEDHLNLDCKIRELTREIQRLKKQMILSRLLNKWSKKARHSRPTMD